MGQTADGLPRATIRTDGALGFPLALLGYPLGIWLPRAYSTGVGIDLSLVGLIITAAAIFDAVTDPLIGFASNGAGPAGPGARPGRPRRPDPDPGDLDAAQSGLRRHGLVSRTLVHLPAGRLDHGAGALRRLGRRAVRQLPRTYPDQLVPSALDPAGLIGATFVPAGAEILLGDAATALVVLESYSWLILVLLPGIGLLLARVPEPAALPGEGSTAFLRSLQLMWKNGLFRRVDHRAW
ncbi:MAG: hypothetical protein U5R48_15090 [Gammaproteobacteria bacterium]|nr:hypothetical protein [Gammaproteobacteria bacterium]